MKWWRKAAEQDLPDAQNNLGARYADGQGVAKDAVEAVKWFRKAAAQNDPEAQFNLGVQATLMAKAWPRMLWRR